MKRPPFAAIVVAAGASRRLRGRLPKPFLRLGRGSTVLEEALRSLARASGLAHAVVAAPRRFLGRAAEILACVGVPGTVTEGGRERQDSVYRGLAAVPPGIPLVLVHDAARPFPPPRLVRAVLSAARRFGAAVPVVPLSDTVKEVAGGRVVRTLHRDRLAAAQTPQGFRTALLLSAYRRVGKRRARFTDDAAVAEAAGFRVRTVAGDEANFKITGPGDWERAVRALREGGRRRGR